MKVTRYIWLLSLVLLIGLTACGGAFAGGDLAGTSWVLVSYDGLPPMPKTQPSLIFDSGSLGGNSSCNHFGGEYRINGDTITIDNLAWTLMACMDEGVMEQEQAYMQMLGGELRYEIAGDQLILTTANGEQLIFSPAE